MYTHGSRRAKNQHYLILGAFDHAGAVYPRDSVGGLPVAKQGVLDIRALEVAWFEWTLKAGPKPEFLKDRVAYYVVGAEEWRYASSVEALPTRAHTYYLDPKPGGAGSADQAGRLVNEPPVTPFTVSYVNDPGDLSKAHLGTWFVGPWVLHQSDVQALDGMVSYS
jgi:hypothetical protein